MSNILDQKKVDRGKSFLNRILARMVKIHSTAEAFSNSEIGLYLLSEMHYGDQVG